MTVYARVNTAHFKERIVEAAVAHSATVEKYGSGSPEAEVTLALLVYYADHFYWLLYPAELDSEGEPIPREEPVIDPDKASQTLAFIKLQYEALLLKRGY